MIGLKRGTVTLYPHDPQWDACAEQTVAVLKEIFAGVALDVRHVGSTAIPSIKAKPIIDIAVAVPHLEDVAPLIPLMREHGFHHKDVGHDRQVFFSAGDFEQDTRTHHIHVVEHDGMEWRNYLNYTAYLNTHPRAARAYEALKERLQAQYSEDRTAYTDGKAEFINHTLRKAMVWSWMGKTVTIGIDRPIGYVHKKDIVYPINYGYIPGVLGGDGEELDVYLLGVDEPIQSAEVKIIATVHREDDVEDKLVAAPAGMNFTRQEIAEAIAFQEKYYHSHVELFCGEYTLRALGHKDEKEEEKRQLCALWGRSEEPWEDGWTLGAYHNDRLLGFVSVLEDTSAAVIRLQLAVHPAWQRRGIGSALLGEVCMRYHNFSRIRVKEEMTEEVRAFMQAHDFLWEEERGEWVRPIFARPPRRTRPQIRLMIAEESASCAELIRTSFLTVADELGFCCESAPRFPAFATNAQDLQRQYQQGNLIFLCCEEDGGLIGCYSLHKKDVETVELNDLCVLPRCRHQKLGERLLLHSFREAMLRGYRIMTIEIAEKNKALRAWCEKYGFEHTGIQRLDGCSYTCGYMKKRLYGEE